MASRLERGAVEAALGPAAELFLREAVARPVDQLPALQEILSFYVEQVRQLYDENPFIDMNLVEAMGQTVRAMLSLYPSVDQETRAAIVGALRYFVLEEDAEGDLDSIVGFDDDAQVVNWVIQAFDLDIPLIPLG